MKKLFVAALGVAIIALSGCDEEQPSQINAQTQLFSTERFTVTRVGEFGDRRAYGQKRGLYTIVDRKSGKEFVGLSGIGITEVVSNGKSTAEQ